VNGASSLKCLYRLFSGDNKSLNNGRVEEEEEEKSLRVVCLQMEFKEEASNMELARSIEALQVKQERTTQRSQKGLFPSYKQP